MEEEILPHKSKYSPSFQTRSSGCRRSRRFPSYLLATSLIRTNDYHLGCLKGCGGGAVWTLWIIEKEFGGLLVACERYFDGNFTLWLWEVVREQRVVMSNELLVDIDDDSVHDNIIDQHPLGVITDRPVSSSLAQETKLIIKISPSAGQRLHTDGYRNNGTGADLNTAAGGFNEDTEADDGANIDDNMA